MIGQLLAGQYRVLQVLGVGGFGQTYITEDLHLPGNPKCVLKHLKPASADRSYFSYQRSPILPVLGLDAEMSNLDGKW